ncbi:MinD/ParA family protein [bacterium]|nr:MinD/ParA family protein [bacterium]
MASIVSIHSFRGGTGKSNTTANLAAVLAMDGKRVGVIDTDIQSPGIHVIFGVGEQQVKHSLNDYLWGKCAIEDTAHDVTATLGKAVPGAIFLIPSSIRAGEITRILREGYDINRLNDGLQDLLDVLNLDILLIDTHPGLNEETLLSLVLSDALLVILRPDSQDYQGTSVTVEIARKTNIQSLLIVVNKVPTSFKSEEVKATVEEAYGCPVVGILPHSEEMMTLASSGIFVVRYPNHPMTRIYKQIADSLPKD